MDDGEARYVSGVTNKTTCDDIIKALIDDELRNGNGFYCGNNPKGRLIIIIPRRSCRDCYFFLYITIWLFIYLCSLFTISFIFSHFAFRSVSFNFPVFRTLEKQDGGQRKTAAASRDYSDYIITESWGGIERCYDGNMAILPVWRAWSRVHNEVMATVGGPGESHLACRKKRNKIKQKHQRTGPESTKKKNKSLQWLHNKRFFPGATRKPRNVKFMSFSKTHSIRSLYPPFKVTPAPIIYVHMYIYIHSHLTYALAYRIYLFMTHRVKSICLLIFISKFMFSFWSNYVVNVLWPQPLAMGIMLFEEKELLIVIWWSYPVNGWKELKTSAKVVLLLEMY